MEGYELSAAQWHRTESFWPVRAGWVGVTVKDNRNFVNGVPRFHGAGSVGAAQRHPVERPAPWVWQLEKHPQAFLSLGQGRNLGENLPSIAGGPGQQVGDG